MPILLDAAYTLILPAEPVGRVYTRHLEATTGLAVNPEDMQAAFQHAFTAANPPDYTLHSSGNMAEREWWRNLVSQVLCELASDEITALDPDTFELFFDSLYTHFADPAAWSLYPETIEFLDAASDLGPLAVVSNFDDRLTPILDGLALTPFFDHIFTSADACARKPDHALFTLALEHLGHPPRKTFHCGDSFEADYQGASALGIHAFHLQRPRHTLFDFLAYRRTHGT